MQELHKKLISDFYAFIKEKNLYRKSFGQTGVKYLLSGNDFSRFSWNDWDKCFQGGKADTQSSRIGQDVCGWSSSFRAVLPVGFWYLNFHRLHHGLPQNDHRASATQQLFNQPSGARIRCSREDSGEAAQSVRKGLWLFTGQDFSGNSNTVNDIQT